MGACKLLVKENEGILVCGNNTRVVRIRVRDMYRCIDAKGLAWV